MKGESRSTRRTTQRCATVTRQRFPRDICLSPTRPRLSGFVLPKAKRRRVILRRNGSLPSLAKLAARLAVRPSAATKSRFFASLLSAQNDMSPQAFTAVHLPIIVSNSTGRVYAESKRLTRRPTAERSEGSDFFDFREDDRRYAVRNLPSGLPASSCCSGDALIAEFDSVKTPALQHTFQWPQRNRTFIVPN